MELRYCHNASPALPATPQSIASAMAVSFRLQTHLTIVHKDTGEVIYVGITNDPTSRKADHERSGRATGDYAFRPVLHDLKYGQARGYEQADIEKPKTLKTCRRGQPIAAGDGNRQRSYNPEREDDPNDHRAQVFKQHRLAREMQHSQQSL
jgi:predicted GIY-YIG superfamily endonuclease